MQKPSLSQSGFFNRRAILALGLCSVAALLAIWSFATPSPSSGTLSLANPTLTYSDGPFVVPNVTGLVNTPPLCTGNQTGQVCSNFTLMVDPTGITPGTKIIKIKVQWPVAAADFDVYVLQGSTVVTSAASSSDPEIAILSVPGSTQTYTIRTVPFAPAGQSYTATVTLEDVPTPPPPSGGPAPRYKDYKPNPSNLSGADSAGEPSIGVDWNPNVGSLSFGTVNTGGVAFFTANLNEYRVSFDDCSSPAKNPNPPGGNFSNAPLWEDVTSPFESLITLDPIGFVDHQYLGEPGTGYPFPSAQLGRVFQSQLAAASSILSFSDEDGNNWTLSQGSGQPAGVDHQTVGGGPYAPTNLSQIPPVIEPPHPLYPHQIYYASQDIGTAFAARSDDGGLTFNTGIPMWNLTQCGGLHGHIKAGPDGTVYVPNKGCGGGQGVAVSRDNGLTWTVKLVPGSTPGDTDPSVAIGSDNTLYFGFINADGTPHVAVSTDHGDTWTTNNPPDVSSGFIQNAVFPEMAAGDGDRASFGFLGTTTDGNYQDTNSFKGVWYFYIATTFDRGQSWVLVDATNGDPVQIGSICTGGTTCGADRNLLDFNDLQVDKEGRAIAAYADGCVAPACTAETANAHNPPYNESRSALSSIIRQSGGPRLFAAFDSQVNCTGSPPTCTPTVPPPPRLNSVTGTAGVSVHIDWSEPDNGGSPLTGYNIYRRTDPGTYGAPLATVTLGCPACKTSYDDLTTLPGVTYFYQVTALNAIGESDTCQEFSIGAAGPPELACLLPGLTILTDPSDDNLDAGTPPPNAVPAHDLQHLWIAEPDTFAPDKIAFTLKVQSLATLPPDTYWPIQFNVGSTTYTARMSTVAPATVLNPAFEYFQGPLNTLLPATTPADPASTYSPDGAITIVVPRSGIGNPAVGSTLTAFLSRIQVSVGGVISLTPDNMPSDLTPTGSYTIVGNLPCNTAPVAELLANPTEGEAPLTVQFDATGSSDPDAGDSVVSYTFDFGDGSPPVTCPGDAACGGNPALISHTYYSNGNYRATLRVTDSHGQESSNLAGVNIEVQVPWNCLMSRKVHGSAGPFDVQLVPMGQANDPNAPIGIECRTGGPNKQFTIIVTFNRRLDRNFQPSAEVTQGTGMVTSTTFGPNNKQVTIQLSGVDNAQHLALSLDNVHDNAGAIINDAPIRMDVLLADVNKDTVVDGQDVSATRGQVGKPVSKSNFRKDVTVDGQIDRPGDVQTVKSQSGNSLP